MHFHNQIIYSRICLILFPSKRGLLFILLLLSGLLLHAQNNPAPKDSTKKIGRKSHERIKLDLPTGRLSIDALPFDAPFELIGAVPDNIIEVRAHYKYISSTDHQPICNCCCQKCDSIEPNCGGVCPWKKLPPCLNCQETKDGVCTDSFRLSIPPLKANAEYIFCFDLIKAPDSSEVQILLGIIQKHVGEHFVKSQSLKDTLGQRKKYFFDDNNIDAVQRQILNDIKLYYLSQGIREESFAPGFILDTNHREVFRQFVKSDYLYKSYLDADSKLNDISKAANDTNQVYLFRIMSSRIEIDTLIKYADTLKLSDALQQRLALLSEWQVLANDLEITHLLMGVLNINRTDGGAISIHDLHGSDTTNLLKITKNLKLSIDWLNSLQVELISELLNNNDIQPVLTHSHLSHTRFLIFLQAIQTFKELLETQRNNCSVLLQGKTNTLEYYNRLILPLNSGAIISIVQNGSTTADFMTRAEYYITADMGLAFWFPPADPGFDKSTVILPYYGINFNFFPINRQVSYSLFSRSSLKFGKRLVRNLSGVIGLSVNTPSSTSQYRKVLFDSPSAFLLTGMGLRISDYIRVSGGYIWYNQRNANPLIDRFDTRGAWYGSVSIDLDVKKYVGNLIDLFK